MTSLPPTTDLDALLDRDWEAGFDEPAMLAEHAPTMRRRKTKLFGLAFAVFGILNLAVQCYGGPLWGTWLGMSLSYGAFGLGSLLLIDASYRGTEPGIKNDGIFFSGTKRRGLLAWVTGLLFTGFYCLLYIDSWSYLIGGWERTLDPLAIALSGEKASKWFLYGFLYTFAVLLFGARMIWRYRHNRYQLLRTASVMFFQLVFAFALPNLLKLFQQPEFYFSYFWPLKQKYLFPSTLEALREGPGLGIFMAYWTVILALIGVPILTYFFGKRWYCSWVCGCGGLAETLGDPWRQLSDKSTKAWRLERWTIHAVLVLIVLVTALLWTNSATKGELLGPELSASLSWWYGFYIGAIFSGIVGVGFYPLLGSRVWCRFGCPQAAILGLFQRFFSRFRITTNGEQCMSCGNCSTYCEMGIDVRAYAQRGENIVRASCVGCGVCAAVCPRGVLKLENGSSHQDRYDGADKPISQLLESIGKDPKLPPV